MACRILDPQLGIKSVPLALESQSLNHWTARELAYILPSLRSICFYFSSINNVAMKIPLHLCKNLFRKDS